MLRDPVKRAHHGPCCSIETERGILRGTNKWGDGCGSKFTDDSIFYECMGCREELEPPNSFGDGIDWSAVMSVVAEHKNAKTDAE